MSRLAPWLLTILALGGCQAGGPPTASAADSATAGWAPGKPLRLATWNLQWLIAPEHFISLQRSCVPRGASPGARKRSIPCDVAADSERSFVDFEALAVYARKLNADVIALQEVDGAAAARRVFPGYRYCFTARDNVQNNGFAVRAGIPFRCGADVIALSLGGSLRRGAELILFPGTVREIRLLGVHLKSGCGKRTLNDPREQCATLARQLPELKRWIDAQAAAARPFAILGDFNRDLLSDSGPARSESGAARSLWSEIDDGEPAEADLRNAAEGERFVNCAPTQRFSAYIDHIVLSRTLDTWRVPHSFGRVVYEPRDAVRRKLSDHCPISIDIRPPN